MSDPDEQNEWSPCPNGVSPLVREAANQPVQGVTCNDQIKRRTMGEGHVLFGGKVIPNRSTGESLPENSDFKE